MPGPIQQRGLVTCLFGLVLLAIGCGATDSGNGTSANAGVGNTPNAAGGMPTWDQSLALGGASAEVVLPVTPSAWKPSEACVALVAERLGQMTWAEKAGQMVQGDSNGASPADVATYGLGSMLSGGGSDPADNDTSAAWVDLVSAYLAQGQTLKAPLLYGIDAVHGHNNASDAVIFPHNIGLGCTRDEALVEEVARITAREVRGTAINWTFAPVLAAALDERWGRTYESYAETPELAAQLGAATIRGLQGLALSRDPSRLLACAKHFAGDGATAQGLDQGNVELTESEFRRVAVSQYQPAINAGVGSIMVSYSSYQGTKMSAQQYWLTDVLKHEMKFSGFLISDWLAVQQVLPYPLSSAGPNPPPTQEALATSINAGLDMIMEPYAHAAVVASILSARAAGLIGDARIDDAVTRILNVKCEMGMLDSDYSPNPDPALTAEIGSNEHLAVARRAVRESIVLLKNDGHILPFSKDSRVLVVGEAADNRVKQCGGWTLDWQGIGKNLKDPGDSTKVTTILSGIRAAIGDAKVTYSATGNVDAAGFTGAVVVVGEDAYAEGVGNIGNLALSVVVPGSSQILDRVMALGIPTAVVILSGRPLVITEQFAKAGAWLAAWLPGSEGGGVADVLFGDYAPSGKLSHSWPRSNAQIPINIGDLDYQSDPPLFPYGYGLTY